MIGVLVSFLVWVFNALGKLLTGPRSTPDPERARAIAGAHVPTWRYELSDEACYDVGAATADYAMRARWWFLLVFGFPQQLAGMVIVWMDACPRAAWVVRLGVAAVVLVAAWALRWAWVWL